MLTLLDGDLVSEFREARHALGQSLSLQGDELPATSFAGRWYLETKNALIDDILLHGPIESRTHRYETLWDASFKRWRLVITPFIFLMPGVPRAS